MSTHNPFEPKSRAKKIGTASVEVEKKELTIADVPEGSMEDVLHWVDNDPEKAKLAIEAEEQGKDRSSLIKTLKKV